MAKLTQNRLQTILTAGLSLKAPEYVLEKVTGRWVGHIISPTFGGKPDHERQEMIWDVLDAQLGADSTKLVGMLLAYTPEEWSLGVAKEEKRHTRKKAV